MIFKGSLISLVALVSSLFAGAPLPRSNDYLGLAEQVKVISQNGASINGGGAFNGLVRNSTTGADFATTFWCVDDQLYFSLPTSTYTKANIILLDDIVDDTSKVRYGSVTNSGTYTWTNKTGSFAALNTSTDRYRAAAYLISQFDRTPTANLQDGLVNNTKNQAIQNTIWALTNNNTPGWDLAGNTAWDATWLQAALDNYLNVDLNNWAVLSWEVDASGNLLAGAGNESPYTDRQTFLVQIVPEPGFYGVLAAGFAGLAFAARRLKQSV